MLRSLLEAVLLGLVQGLSEFIPISSSGHLVLVATFLNLQPRGLAFDVALHTGTMAAVIVLFRHELRLMARGILGLDSSPDGLLYRRLGGYIVIASIPVGIAGTLLEGFFARVFVAPLVVASFLLVTAALLFTGEYIRDRRVTRAGSMASVTSEATSGRALPVGIDPADPSGTKLDQVSLRQAFAVGVGQCLALFPGVSRSGTTIVTGMAVGLTREAATRFSFLLALPALAGATLVSIPELVSSDRAFTPLDLGAGVATAFVSGYFAMRFLIALVARDRLTPFAWYCLTVGLGAIAALLLR